MRSTLVVLSLALLAGSARQVPSPGSPLNPSGAPKGTGLILGRVVDAATGQPVAEAMVNIQGGGRGGGASVPVIAGLSGDRVLTGPDGRFLFRDLRAGSNPIIVAAAGYLTGGPGQSRPAANTSPVQVADAERITGLVIRLWKYGVLSGTVIDEAGEPAVNMTVRAFSRTMANGRPRFGGAATARTDDRGMYRIASLVPGDYLVGVPQTQTSMPAAIMESMMQGIASGAGSGASILDLMSSGGPPPTATGVRIGDSLVSSESGSAPAPSKDGRIYVYQTLFFSSATTIVQAMPVTVRSGEERPGVDFQLRLIPTQRVAGTVVGPSGPVSGVGVRLVPAGADLAAAGDSAGDVATAATTATRADGSFTFYGVPEGQFMARVMKQPRQEMPAGLANSPMLQMVLGSSGPPPPDAAKLLFADLPVNVAGADVTGVSIVLREGMRVSGRLEYDGAAAKPTPQQLQGMRAVLTPADGRPQTPMNLPTVPPVDRDGLFKTGQYPSGSYAINVVGVPAPWTPRSATVAGRDVFRQTLDLRDADVTDLVITYTDKQTQMTGVVRGDSGAAPMGTPVLLFPQDYRTWIANGMSGRLTRDVRTTTAAGAYSMRGLLPGDYLVAAFDAGASDNQDQAFFEALARVATHISIVEGESKSQDLKVVAVKR
jgi:hypothetical protein